MRLLITTRETWINLNELLDRKYIQSLRKDFTVQVELQNIIGDIFTAKHPLFMCPLILILY